MYEEIYSKKEPVYNREDNAYLYLGRLNNLLLMRQLPRCGGFTDDLGGSCPTPRPVLEGTAGYQDPLWPRTGQD